MKLTFVVMDCGNEATFERCIQSISLQSMADYEVLVVGAQDLAEISAEGIRAKYITCPEDIQYMLEAAMDAAQGEYVCFIDSVHCYSPFFAEKMTAMCDEGADMACCGYVGIQRDTLLSQVGVPLMMYHPETITGAEYMERCKDSDTVSVGMYNYFENKLYRYSLLEKHRPLADESTIGTGIVQKLRTECEKVAVTAEPLLFVCIG